MTQAPRGAADTAAPTDSPVTARPLPALAWAVAALIVAVVLALTFPAWRYSVSYAWSLSANYLLTWGPLVVALAFTAAFWRRFLAFRPTDIYLGIMVGVVARAVGIIVQYLISGRMPGGNLILGGVSGIYIFTAVIAPVVLAPLIEEPFFRGLLQGSLDRVIGPWPALIATSVVFTLVHTIAEGWSVTLIVTLLVYALLAGYVTQQTKRLAPAIIGHAAFNGLAALISWPW
ncbi:CPBP family intramembrane glutamic endopeptidase [Gryllotalpicola koreensis]|uniref:CAAX prenyl protease 2/Lysostaphin resistance protein A-like domain-containing protein n=1 Tax=Gryllotalpicola koreensis TaxID=993086 RepID=A0ABP8A0C3_9MICO